MFGGHPLLKGSFESLPDGWFNKVAINSANSASWKARFDRLTKWLIEREEQKIVMVAHYGIFKVGLCRASVDQYPRHAKLDYVQEGLGEEFANCEVMKFSLSNAGKWEVVRRQPRVPPLKSGWPRGKPPVLQPGGLRGQAYAFCLFDGCVLFCECTSR